MLDRFARDEWNLGIVRQTVYDIVRDGIHEPVRWFPHNSWRIFADPCCIVQADGSLIIVAELLNHWIGKGQIQMARVPKGGDPLKADFHILMGGPSHLSYPHLVQDRDDLYMLVESYEAGGLGLWQIDAAYHLHFVKLLLPRPAIDATLYNDGTRWWLFCTFFDDAPNTNLHLFHASSLIGQWHAHPHNPIVRAKCSARPAGPLFQVGADLIRPSQDSSVTYGGQLIFNRVERLTPCDYAETRIRVVVPQSDYYCDGIHTIVGAGDYTIIDGKRWHRGLVNVPCRISAKAHRMYRAGRARCLFPQPKLTDHDEIFCYGRNSGGETRHDALSGNPG